MLRLYCEQFFAYCLGNIVLHWPRLIVIRKALTPAQHNWGLMAKRILVDFNILAHPTPCIRCICGIWPVLVFSQLNKRFILTVGIEHPFHIWYGILLLGRRKRRTLGNIWKWWPSARQRQKRSGCAREQPQMQRLGQWSNRLKSRIPKKTNYVCLGTSIFTSRTSLFPLTSLPHCHQCGLFSRALWGARKLSWYDKSTAGRRFVAL